MVKEKSKEILVLDLPKMNMKSMVVGVTGTSPLIVHRWAHKARGVVPHWDTLDSLYPVIIGDTTKFRKGVTNHG
jgi:hypothetical protein